MAKAFGTTITVKGTDKVNIVFSSNGDQSLPVGAGVAVVSTGSNVNGNAVAHGQVAGTTVLIHNPA